jgi:hypothetical protein
MAHMAIWSALRASTSAAPAVATMSVTELHSNVPLKLTLYRAISAGAIQAAARLGK